jgi:hypothetical protein
VRPCVKRALSCYSMLRTIYLRPERTDGPNEIRSPGAQRRLTGPIFSTGERPPIRTAFRLSPQAPRVDLSGV